MSLSSIQQRALAYIRAHPGCRISDIGWHLWGETTEAPGCGEGSHGQNKFCRPAGKVCRVLRKAGLTYEVGYEGYTGYHAEGTQ